MNRIIFARCFTRVLVISMVLLVIGVVPAFALIGPSTPPPDSPPSDATVSTDRDSDPASLADRYKLKMIRVNGQNLEGFDKDKLDYTYYMSSAEETALTASFGAEVTFDLINGDAEVIKSVIGNKVLLYVNNNMDPDGLTYTVTFLKSVDQKGSGLIFRENRYLLEIGKGKFSSSELRNRTRASLDLIKAEILKITDPTEAEKAYLELQDTLEALIPILDILKSDPEVVQGISEMTDSSRNLVRWIRNPGRIADLTVGYYGKMKGVLNRIDTANGPGNTLKNSIQNLGSEGVHQTGTLSAVDSQIATAGEMTVVTFEAKDVTLHLGSAKSNFSKIANGLSNLLGANNPRKLEYTITLKANKPKGVLTLETTLSKDTLAGVQSNGAKKLELQLGEAAVAFSPGLLTGDEKTLKLSTAYSPSPTGDTPRGTGPIPGGYIADVTLSSEAKVISGFDLPVLLTLDLSGVDLAKYTDKNLRSLGLYLLDEKSGRWSPVGGNYDSVMKTIQANRLHLSKYTVLKTDKSFSDVQNSWAKDDINELLGKGVVKEEAIFSPKGDLTREDFARWIAKAYGLEAGGQELPFKDVNKDHPYYKELAAAYSQGLIKGKSATAFDPKGKITRQEMATLISNALIKYQQAQTDSSLVTKLNKYPDSKQVAAWAKDNVALVNELGIMQGDTRGFRPNDYISREEAATVLKRIYN